MEHNVIIYADGDIGIFYDNDVNDINDQHFTPVGSSIFILAKNIIHMLLVFFDKYVIPIPTSNSGTYSETYYIFNDMKNISNEQIIKKLKFKVNISI